MTDERLETIAAGAGGIPPLRGLGVPHVSDCDAEQADWDADEDDERGEALARGYAERMSERRVLTASDQRVVADLLGGEARTP